MPADQKIVVTWIKSDSNLFPKANGTYSYLNFSTGTNIKDELGLLVSQADSARYTDAVFSTYKNLDSDSKRIINEVMNQLGTFTSLDFTLVSYSNNETIMFGGIHPPLPANATNPNQFVGGFTDDHSHPDPDNKSYIFFNRNLYEGAPYANGDELYAHTVRHEVLHALGMADFSGTPYDSMKYTVMSYKSHSSFNSQTDPVYATSYMLLDYEAMRLLGILQGYDSKDVFEFKTSKVLETVYDTGGINSFDFDNQNKGVIADLRQGHFSSVGSSQAVQGDVAIENLAIAYGTVIKNVTGSDNLMC